MKREYKTWLLMARVRALRAKPDVAVLCPTAFRKFIVKTSSEPWYGKRLDLGGRGDQP